MSHHWYWQNRGTTYGPLSTDELESLVRRHRVLDDDSLRVDGTDDWVSGLEIKALFAESLQGNVGETAAESAANALSHRARLGLAQDSEKPSAMAILGAYLGKIVRSVGNLGSTLQLLVFRAVTPVTSRLNRPVVLSLFTASLLVVAAVKVLSGVEFRDTKAADAQVRLSETWDEFQAMKRRRAPQAEWEAFERETIAWLKPMLTTLGEAATANQASPIQWGQSGFDKGLGQQQLVSAGWILRDLIVDARKKSLQPESREHSPTMSRTSRLMTFPTDPPEVMFSKRMAMAEAYLNGTADTLRPAHVKPPEETGNWWTTGILSAGGCVLIGGAGWWWKQRR